MTLHFEVELALKLTTIKIICRFGRFYSSKSVNEFVVQEMMTTVTAKTEIFVELSLWSYFLWSKSILHYNPINILTKFAPSLYKVFHSLSKVCFKFKAFMTIAQCVSWYTNFSKFMSKKMKKYK